MKRRCTYWVFIVLPIFAFHRLFKWAFFIGFFMEKDKFLVIYQFFGKELKLKGFDKELFAYIYGITSEEGKHYRAILVLDRIKSYFENDSEVEKSLSKLLKKGLVKIRVTRNFLDNTLYNNYVINVDKINEIRKQYQLNLQK